MTRSKQTTDGIVYGDDTNPMTYTYNLSGALIEQKYPSGRVVKNILDTDGELTTVQSKKNANHAFWNYANHFTSNAAGAVTKMQLGNGRWENTAFNSRLQPTQIALGRTQNATDLLKLDYQHGDLNAEGAVLTGSNNGNVAKQTITVAAVGATPGFTAIQNYDYDPLNRIQIASETLTPTTGTPESWVQEFRYDRFGNRTFHEATTTTLPRECNGNTEVCVATRPVVNPSASTTNNRLNGYTFDAVGNTIRDAENRKFIYDAENKQTKVQTVDGSGNPTGTAGEYWYDGDGKRIKKRAYRNNVLTEETIFVYDAIGKLIGEYSNEVSSRQDAKVAYITNDHLGSPRINTDINGNVTARHDYHPFGEGIGGPQTTNRSVGLGYIEDTFRKRFTGYERDSETELDYAVNRHFSSSLGRFLQADPYSIVLEKEQSSSGEAKRDIVVAYLSQPQNWNRYSYAINNPLRFVDPNGEKPKVINVFISLEKGQETDAGKKAFEVIQKEAAAWGVKVNIFRFEEGTATKKQFLASLDERGQATVFIGHAVDLNGLLFSGSNLSAKDLNGKIVQNTALAVFACDTGNTFNQVYGEITQRTALVTTNSGYNRLSLIDANYNGGQNFVYELARTGSTIQAADLARRGVRAWRNDDHYDDTVDFRRLPTSPSPTSRTRPTN